MIVVGMIFKIFIAIAFYPRIFVFLISHFRASDFVFNIELFLLLCLPSLINTVYAFRNSLFIYFFLSFVCFLV